MEKVVSFVVYLLETLAVVAIAVAIFISLSNKKTVYENCYYGDLKSCDVVYEREGLIGLSKAINLYQK